jgi:hypothetical protein
MATLILQRSDGLHVSPRFNQIFLRVLRVLRGETLLVAFMLTLPA